MAPCPLSTSASALYPASIPLYTIGMPLHVFRAHVQAALRRFYGAVVVALARSVLDLESLRFC